MWNIKNPLIHNLNEKSADKFTSNTGLYLRRKLDRPFKFLCNLFTNANIIWALEFPKNSDEEYFRELEMKPVPLLDYPVSERKNNIVLERYPVLEKEEPYIFACNHTCPEDIETILNVLDRNAYLVLGSLESLRYNREMYLLWLNGMIPFDILDKEQRSGVMSKMERVLKNNSILIFPEGSHNYHPSNLVNPLFDGMVNLALKTGRKIVPITLVKDKESNVAYIDVGRPVDVYALNVPHTESEKKYVNAITSIIRDKMATAVYHSIVRHIPMLCRREHPDIAQEYRSFYSKEAFSALKWRHDVFEAEYLVKKTAEQRAYEEVIQCLGSLRFNDKTIRETGLNSRGYVLKKLKLEQENVAGYMREYWKSNM